MGDVYQHIEHSEGRHEASADDQNATNVADDVGVFLGRPGCQQTLAAGATGPHGLSGPTAVASSRSTCLSGPFLGNYLRLELGCAGFLGIRERSGRTGRGACLGSGGAMSVGTPLARTVRSTGTLGHVR